MLARAPAKAILSGEHAVVYGAPALAVAVGPYANVRVDAKGHPDQLKLTLADLDQQLTIDRGALMQQMKAAEDRYQQFLDQNWPIKEVLQQPESLYLFAVARLLQRFPDLSLGLDVHISSDIPVGAGMGSSAATVAAMLTAISEQGEVLLDTQGLFELTHEAEQLQHGRSSGIDPAACCWGGMIRFQQGKLEQRQFAISEGWYLIDTGRPSVSTGECGEQVRRQFLGSAIWSEFSDVTNSLEKAIKATDQQSIIQLIHKNHQLLTTIGVVPDSVQTLAGNIESLGGAAKISGAGAIAGEQAGLVMVYWPDLVKDDSLITKLGLKPMLPAVDGATAKPG